MTPRRPAPRPGVTLIEILLVVVVVALLAGIAVPRLNLGKYRADAAARLVLTVMQLVSRTAVLRQHDVVLSFDVAGRRMRILEDRDNDRTADPGEPVRWRILEEGARFAVPARTLAGATGASAVTGTGGSGMRTVDGMPSVIFHRDGSASTAAEIYLTSARPTATDFRAVTMNQATGRLTWYRYTGSGWLEAAR